MAAPLAGVRVLDLAQFTAGPLGAMVLGDLGAEVVKIEKPGGEDGRRLEPLVRGVSLYYLLNNRNKRAVTLNLRQAAGRAILRRLIARADVLVESHRPGTLDALGLGYDRLRALNPGLILVSVTGYGQSGPYRDRGGFDMLAQAEGGLMALNAPPGGAPLKVGTSPAAYATGLNAAIGVLAALRQRDQTGQGQWLDLALLDNVVAMIEADIPYYGLTGETLPRTGNRRLYSTPTNSYPTRDGYVYIAASNDTLWRRFCQVIGQPELADDPRFRRNADRRANVEACDQVVADWVAGQTVQQVVETLTAAGVPCGPVNDIPAMVRDPQVAARQMLQPARHPTLGEVLLPGEPLKLAEVEPPAAWVAEPGQDNAAVYGEWLGVGADEVAAWANAGVV